MEDNKLKERDFQVYQGYKFPFLLKLAWVILTIWMTVYTIQYVMPDLKFWLNK